MQAEHTAAPAILSRGGLRVAAQGTGHNAAPLGPLDDTLLVKTHAMRQVSIDPAARTARAEAGAVWADVVGPAAGYGLAGLTGSSPDVGVAGYTLGGGMGWLGRAYGLSANNVESVDLVTADGRFRCVGPVSEPDLFWALRGGGGSFGVVTALELRLFPVASVYAGLLWWPIDAAREVLPAWQELTASGLPDEFTTVFRFMRFPPVPDVPEPVRGRPFVVIDVIHLGSPAEADALLAPLRRLRPAAAAVQTVMSAMAPWAAPQTYLNFTGASRGPASFWTPQAYDRLRRIKAAVDPGELIRANHPVPPADDSPAGQASAGDPMAAAWPAAGPATWCPLQPAR